MAFFFQVEKGSWSGEMTPMTIEEQPLGQWEVQIQTNTPLTFIKVKTTHTIANALILPHPYDHPN